MRGPNLLASRLEAQGDQLCLQIHNHIFGNYTLHVLFKQQHSHIIQRKKAFERISYYDCEVDCQNIKEAGHFRNFQSKSKQFYQIGLRVLVTKQEGGLHIGLGLISLEVPILLECLCQRPV